MNIGASGNGSSKFKEKKAVSSTLNLELLVEAMPATGRRSLLVTTL